MYSKILPFNKVLINKDLKLTKWIIWFVIFGLFFSITLGVISTYRDFKQFLNRAEERPEDFDSSYIERRKGHIKESLEYRFKYLAGLEHYIIVLFPIAVTALLFGEEKRRKTLEMLAAMPFSRYEIFFNKIIIAFINVFLPYLINALIMIVALGLSKGLGDFYTINMVMAWFGMNLYRLFVMLTFSLFFASLTGTSISHIVLTLIFFVFPIGFAGLVNWNLSEWGYFPTHIYSFLFESNLAYYTVPSILVNSTSRVGPAIYYQIIRGIVLLFISKILFEKNKLERSGETLEFESIETFFKFGVAICTSLLFGLIFKEMGEEIIHTSSNIFMILGYIVGLAFGWFVSNLSIRLNRAKV
ncbi:MAG TPA: ABC transporter permease [Thermoanaerobacterales bacterium]|nr:ABC transporter permease [Thermoanaerobacterales bacterium]